MLELNDIIGLQVKSSLMRGIQPGTSDLLLEVKESRPYRVSFDGDNFGSRYTGRNRFGVSGTIGNVIRFGDRFDLRVVGSDAKQKFFNPSYSIPITSYGTDFRLSYIYSDHQLGANLAILEGGGHSHIATASVSHPLIRTRRARLNLTAGLDFKFFENYLLNTVTSKDEMGDVFFGIDGFPPIILADGLYIMLASSWVFARKISPTL